MTTLNRTQAPQFSTLTQVDLQQAVTQRLENGIELSVINAGSQEVLKIEMQFQAGTVHEGHLLVAQATNALLREGTKSYSAAYVAEFLDAHGAFLENETYKHHSSVILYCLNKHLVSLLPVLKSIVSEPLFSENEFQLYLKKQIQQFSINLQKVDGLARLHFSPSLFGNKHVYGRQAEMEDYESLKAGMLADFHRQYYVANGARIIVSGYANQSAVNAIAETFSKGINVSTGTLPQVDYTPAGKTGEVFIEKKEAIQSAIRIGRPLFNKLHPDFHAMQVLNCVFGGYFGSRLMSNIREDKGYTYGIGSGIMSLKHGGYFYIATEVGVDVCASALKEIYLEMDRLQNEEIPAEELRTVKNYMTGVFLRSTSGPFELADKYVGLLDYGLEYDYYNKYLKTINTITAEDLMNLAKKYLNKNEMLQLVAGKV